MIQFGNSSLNLLIEDIVIAVHQTVSDLYHHVHCLVCSLDRHHGINNVILTSLQADHALLRLQLRVIYMLQQAGKNSIERLLRPFGKPGSRVNSEWLNPGNTRR